MNQSKGQVLIIGQTPPPYHGQSVMIQKITEARCNSLEMHFLRMNYSSEIDQVGRFSFRKIWLIIKLLNNARKIILKENIDLVYYPPAGTGMVPIIRDIISLIYLRRFNCSFVLHFHAMGLEESYRKMSILKFLFKKAFFGVEACIGLSEFNVRELSFLQAKKIEIVPYGVGNESVKKEEVSEEMVTILYVGNIIESKGVLKLLDSVESLTQKGLKINAEFVGGMTSKSLEEKIRSHPSVTKGIAKFLGIKVGDEKEKLFKKADIFCFPTFYENENFPVVILEAMMFSLPIVSTKWRGIPSMVDNSNGFLIKPKDQSELNSNLEKLIENKSLRLKLGEQSRIKYDKRFREEIYKNNICNVLTEIIQNEQK
ncbi:glycosyltransferase family 4 protein [Ekhidna sp.]|uniref:glycosyltransferase family 4 protein n=1 Tax=Ekhidna sp. TaxID=2608089 RepID=UPI003CCC3E20